MNTTFRLILFIILILNSAIILAEEPIVSLFKPTKVYTYERDPIPNGNFEKLILPLKHAQNLLMVEATINGITGNFILDTGAPYLVVNKTYFRDDIIKTNLVSAGITGSGGEVQRTLVKKLQIQELFYENIEADIANLAPIENSKGVKVLGLLGTNLFTQFEIIIDLRNDNLTLYKLNKQGERIYKDSTIIVPETKMPFTLTNNIIFINGKVNEKNLSFCFDSAAEVNVLSTNVNKKIVEDFVIARRSILVGSGGQKAEVITGVVKQIDIGGQQYNNMQTYLTSITELQKVYSTYFDGIIGYPLMFYGSVGINFKKKEFSMYLYKN